MHDQQRVLLLNHSLCAALSVAQLLTSLLQVDPAGAVTLDSGGDRSAGMLDALNAGVNQQPISDAGSLMLVSLLLLRLLGTSVAWQVRGRLCRRVLSRTGYPLSAVADRRSMTLCWQYKSELMR